jgi:exosortase/archaeosortase family protein
VSPKPLAFGLRLVVLVGLLTALSLTPPFKSFVEEPLIDFNAWLSHYLLRLIGVEASLHGRFVYGPAFSFEVVSGCTGIFVFLLVLSAVLAFPARWRSRLVCLLGVAALIFVLNQVRIVSLYFVGAHWRERFEDMHLYVWQGFIIVAVTVYWYVWAARSGRPDAAAEA